MNRLLSLGLVASLCGTCGPVFTQDLAKQWPKPTPGIEKMLNEALAIKDKARRIDELKTVIGEAKAINDFEGRAEAENDVGKACKAADAVAWFEAAIKDFAGAGNKKEEGGAAKSLGSCYLFSLGRPRKALEAYHRALKIAHAINDRDLEGRTLINIGTASREIGEHEQALDYYSQALAIVSEVKDKQVVGMALNNIGLVYNQLGQQSKALDAFARALPVERDVGDRQTLVQTLLNIGMVHNQLGERLEAVHFYNQSLTIARAIGDTESEGYNLINIGIVYHELGQLPLSLDYFDKALSIEVETGDRYGQRALLINIGNVYLSLGKYEQALDYFNRGLPIAREFGDRRDEADTLWNIGVAYMHLQRNREALEYESRALPIARGTRDQRLVGGLLAGIGNVYRAQGQNQKALDYYRASLPISRVAGDTAKTGETLTDIGDIYRFDGKNQKALQFYNLGLPICREVRDRGLIASSLDGVSQTLSALKLPALAIVFAKQSVNEYQGLRKDIQKLPRADQDAYDDKVEPAYRRLANLLIKQGRLREAGRVMSLLKQEENFEFVARDAAVAGTVEGRLEAIGAEAGWWNRYQLIQDKALQIDTDEFDLTQKTSQLKTNKMITAKQQVLLARMETRLKVLDQQKDILDKAADLYFEEVGKLASTLAESVRKDAEARVNITGNELPTFLRRLHRNSGEKVGAVYALAAADELDFLIVTYAAMKHMSVAVRSDDLNTMIYALRKDLMNPNADPRIKGEKLYNLVFEKLIRQLHSAGCTRVVWCLDGTMRYIPIGALWDGKEYLIERDDFTMFDPLNLERVSADSAKNLLAAGFAATEGKGTMFAPLPGADKELKGVVNDHSQSGFSGAVPGRAYENAAFDEANLVAAMKGDQFSILHIATHFNVGKDFNSSNLLLGDGNLFSLKQFTDAGKHGALGHLDLVCLSACDTAESFADSISAGSQFSSFVSLTLKDGASSVVASLWPVSDASTPLLMKRFYEGWMAHPDRGKAEALRTAQRSLLHAESADVAGLPRSEAVNDSQSIGDKPFTKDPKHPFAHPYYWAPFILFGNWK